jgi:cytoskeletal protein RodZ
MIYLNQLKNRSSTLAKNMISKQYIKLGSLAGLLCTLMLTVTVAVSQTHVQAQITPAPEKFGSDESSTNSSPSTDNGNDGDSGGSTDSSSSDDDEDDGGGDTGADDTEEASTSDDDGTIEESENNQASDAEIDGATQLADAIKNRVADALSAAGIDTPIL